jgi:hypothetical protein
MVRICGRGVLLSLLGALLASLLQCGTAGRSRGPVPEEIVNVAQEYVVARVGKDAFARYFVYDDSASAHIFPRKEDGDSTQPYRIVKYALKIDAVPEYDRRAILKLDDEGKLLRDPRGVPDCVKDSSECEFNVNEAAARRIAADAGLKPGIREWHAQFLWHPELGYIWAVESLLDKDSRRWSGESLLIDANTGEVLERRDWSHSPPLRVIRDDN